MRFIHTADWHLGRLFHGVHLTDDQRHLLGGQFVDLVKAARPDLLIVAGDVYDRAVPPPDAVQLLDDLLSTLVLELQVPVLLIAGNHDSPGRLSFGSRLLAGRRLYVTGCVTADCPPLVLEDAHGPVHFYPLPYAEPATVRQCLACDEVLDHGRAMRLLTDGIRSRHAAGARSVAIGHAFVAGGAESESERPLRVGGAGTVDASCFDGFHYTALGHLHRPQTLGAAGAVRYSGSPLKYSFDEAGDDAAKSAYVVDMDGTGTCTCESVAFTPRRDVRRIDGKMADLLKGPQDGRSADDYLEVTLLDDGPVLDAIGKLRDVYPNVLSIRRPERTPQGQAGDRPDVRKMSDVALFKSFYQHVSGDELSAEQEQTFVRIVEDMQRREREGDAVGTTKTPEHVAADAASEGALRIRATTVSVL
jgi:exonuclease SbcD